MEKDIVKEVANGYDLDTEELIKFLYDIGELYDKEEFIELAEMLEE